MAITDYSSLQTAIQNWMDRTDISGDVTEIIQLAEARLNRKLNVVETDVTLTGTAASRSIDVSALSIVEPITLKVVDNGDEYDVTPRPDGGFNYTDDSRIPMFWALDGTNIDFDSLLDEAYEFRFRYQGRFALSNTVTTNNLLTNHPDVYLAACMVWGGLFVEDDRKVAKWKALLDEFMDETRNAINAVNKGVVTVDPMLKFIGTGHPLSWGTR